MGRGEACEITGPDGAVYRRGRRRPVQAEGAPARPLSSPLLGPTAAGEEFRSFLAGGRRPVIELQLQAEAYTFFWEGRTHRFAPRRSACRKRSSRRPTCSA